MIIKPAIGAIRNWPKEPPALTRPKAKPDFSGGILLFIAAIAT